MHQMRQRRPVARLPARAAWSDERPPPPQSRPTCRGRLIGLARAQISADGTGASSSSIVPCASAKTAEAGIVCRLGPLPAFVLGRAQVPDLGFSRSRQDRSIRIENSAMPDILLPAKRRAEQQVWTIGDGQVRKRLLLIVHLFWCGLTI